MHKLIKITLAAALPVVWAAGCTDFLKGGELTNNPNNAVIGSASNNQLFIPIQANQWAQQNSEVAWSIAMWMQELFGNARQQVGVYQYTSLSNGTFDGDMITVYTGGGLVDLRQLELQAVNSNDKLYQGIALVLEGWMVGNAADWWGDIPYSQAVDFAVYPTPVLDPQQVVYDSVIARLNLANTLLDQGGGGPGAADLVYGGDSVKWGQLAHTLKARFMLHMVLAGGATYAQVLAEAQQGISSDAGDYLPLFQAPQSSSNNWWQEMAANGGTGRAGDIIADTSTVLAETMKFGLVGQDPRYNFYFDNSPTGDAGMNTARLALNYRQPLVTYNENLLIIAEAKLHTGDAAGALTALQAEQAIWNTGNAWHPAIAVPGSATATDQTIQTEKYITLFQNVEVWNDWKRLCIPTIPVVTVINGGGLAGTVPARLLYGLTEQQTNPNVPPVGTPPNGAFNWNDTRHGCSS